MNLIWLSRSRRMINELRDCDLSVGRKSARVCRRSVRSVRGQSAATPTQGEGAADRAIDTD